MTTKPRSWDPVPNPHNWQRAILSDELYQRMIKNPDERVPFLVNWPRVSRLAPV